MLVELSPKGAHLALRFLRILDTLNATFGRFSLFGWTPIYDITLPPSLIREVQIPSSSRRGRSSQMTNEGKHDQKKPSRRHPHRSSQNKCSPSKSPNNAKSINQQRSFLGEPTPTPTTGTLTASLQQIDLETHHPLRKHFLSGYFV